MFMKSSKHVETCFVSGNDDYDGKFPKTDVVPGERFF